jgi:hypothetical protein
VLGKGTGQRSTGKRSHCRPCALPGKRLPAVQAGIPVLHYDVEKRREAAPLCLKRSSSGARTGKGTAMRIPASSSASGRTARSTTRAGVLRFRPREIGPSGCNQLNILTLSRLLSESRRATIFLEDCENLFQITQILSGKFSAR